MFIDSILLQNINRGEIMFTELLIYCILYYSEDSRKCDREES
jgi:hypothetical protein